MRVAAKVVVNRKETLKLRHVCVAVNKLYS